MDRKNANIKNGIVGIGNLLFAGITIFCLVKYEATSIVTTYWLCAMVLWQWAIGPAIAYLTNYIINSLHKR